MPDITTRLKIVRSETKVITYTYKEIYERLMDSYGDYLTDMLQEAKQALLEGDRASYNCVTRDLIALPRSEENGVIPLSVLQSDVFPFWATEVMEYCDVNDEDIDITIDYQLIGEKYTFSSTSCDW